ncbi:MAG: hypothetical protein L0228_01450 [Planctomycetes bacterium]|nr:hypothetical protein [Planctomycetota bacterium]
MKHSLKAIVVVGSIVGIAVCARVDAAVPVVWDGSAGISSNPTLPTGVRRWEEGNWTRDGIPGQTAVAAIGQDGHVGGRGGVDIILGSGHLVYHDHNDGNTVPGALGDFKPQMDLFGPGSLTIKDGATLWMDSHSDSDGRWTRVGMSINLDNGTLLRTITPAWCPPSECSSSGGKIIFGYRNELLANTRIEINLTNGGRIESHGKMAFGDPSFWDENPPGTVNDNPQTGHNPGIEVAMTINNGTLDLTGGNAWPDYFGLADGELGFFYESVGPNTSGAPVGPKNEEYSINFTGPGQIIVDTGIFVAEQGSDGVYSPKGGFAPDLFTSITYQNLWDLGILQANGLSGLTGATFSDYFTTTGAPDDPNLGIDNDNYTLTSLLASPGLPGDYNGDGSVDLADYVLWRKNPADHGGNPAGYNTWLQNFGETSGPGGSGAVPEPVSLMPVMIGLAGLWLGRRNFVRGR